MLLLVLDAELDQRAGSVRQRRQRPIEPFIDMRPPVADLVEARPTDHPAAVARNPLAFAFVIAVEKIGEPLIERRDPKVAQHERLEEPRRMRQVPFGR